MPRRLRAGWVLAWICLAAIPWVHAASVTATLDPDATTPGEPVTYFLVFEGVDPGGAPAVPSLPNLSITYTGQSSQYSIVNGRVSSSLTHSYAVTAAQPGTYTIPAITVPTSAGNLSTRPVTLRVVQSAAAAQDSALARLAMLQVITPKTDVYVGESFPVEIRLYYISAQEIQIPQLKGDGFTFGKPAQPSQGRVQISGTIYNAYVFKQTAVAAKAGPLSLGPAECDLTLRIPQQRPRSGGGLFDMFGFGDPRVALRRTTLRSEPVAMNVLPLPTANVPAAFNGAVGRFSLQTAAAPTNVAVGDPITLSVKIAGQGGFDALSLPDYAAGWRSFKAYPPTSNFEPADALGLEGVKSFEQILIPEDAAIRQLPGFQFCYFDPSRKSYVTLDQPPIPVTIRPSAQPPAQPTILAASVDPAARPAATNELRHIKPRAANWLIPQPALITRPGFLALQLVPLLAWLSAVAWRKRQQFLQANPKVRRRLQLEHTIGAARNALRHHAQENQPGEFYAQAFHLLQEILGERLDLPSASITEAVIDERLRPLQVPESVLDSLHRLFLACNQARYAPQTRPGDLANLLAELDAMIPQLRAIGAPAGSSAPAPR